MYMVLVVAVKVVKCQEQMLLALHLVDKVAVAVPT
jgi:hypothetical protein